MDATETDFRALATRPAAFDSALARLHADVAETERAMGAVLERAHTEAGDTRKENGHSEQAAWAMSAGEALVRAPEATRLYYIYHADLVRLTGAITAAGRDCTGWSRFFPTETSSGGHIHSSLYCRTLYDTTDIRWRPDLSGRSAEEAVAMLGPLFCQVCFPEAREEYKRDPREYARECAAARKSAERAEREARNAPKKLADSEPFEASDGDPVTRVAACKKLIREAARLRVELDWYRSPAAAQKVGAEHLAGIISNVSVRLDRMEDDAARAAEVLTCRGRQHEGYGATAEEIARIRGRGVKKARKEWGL